MYVYIMYTACACTTSGVSTTYSNSTGNGYSRRESIKSHDMHDCDQTRLCRCMTLQYGIRSDNNSTREIHIFILLHICICMKHNRPGM